MIDSIIAKEIVNINKKCNLTPLQNSSIIITGSSGLIGTYLLGCLYDLNQEGYNIDVHFQHYRELPEHLRFYFNEDNFKSLTLDLSNYSSYKKLPTADYIIHAASIASPIFYYAGIFLQLCSFFNLVSSFFFFASRRLYSSLS